MYVYWGTLICPKQFLAREHLKPAMCHSSSKVLFTFETKSNFSRLLIDHFFVSESLFKYIYLYI